MCNPTGVVTLVGGYHLYHRFLMDWHQSPFCPALLFLYGKPKFGRRKWLGKVTLQSLLYYWNPSQLQGLSLPSFVQIALHVFSPVVSVFSVWDLIIFIHSPYAEMYSWVPTMGPILAETNRTYSYLQGAHSPDQCCPNEIMWATNIILNFQVDAFKQA